MCKRIRIWAFLLLTLSVVPQNGLAQSLDSNDKVEVVKQYIDAFNSQDAKRMVALVTNDVRWMTINGDKISVEVKGKSALNRAMTEYFGSCSTCRSVIVELISGFERVSVLEEASWISRSGKRSQRSMAVYEFTDGLIRTVYYFPEESETKPESDQ